MKTSGSFFVGPSGQSVANIKPTASNVEKGSKRKKMETEKEMCQNGQFCHFSKQEVKYILVGALPRRLAAMNLEIEINNNYKSQQKSLRP